jgi:putative restriction endonuclease
MTKAVLIQSRHAGYSDVPGERYQFPSRSYLSVAVKTIGDWVVFYEGRRGGGRGYYAVQRVERIVPDPVAPDRHLILFDAASLLSFETPVPYTDESGAPFESRLARPDGRPATGGLNTSAIRLLPEADFARIIDKGLTPIVAPEAIPRHDTIALPDETHRLGFAEAPAGFDLATDRRQVLTSRTLREQSFARQVKVAYRGRCALSGLSLRNGGGRAEVNAAHIRPVADLGPDVVQNGLALSGTLHWMFDRGLVSVDEDHSILVAKGSVAGEVEERLLAPDRRLILPSDPLQRPHPAFLAWHRRNVFKG